MLSKAWGSLVASLVVLPTIVQAQTASQITPQSFRPNLERPGGFALSGGGGLATPDGAEKLSVRLSGIRVKGGLPELAVAGAELERRLTGRPVSAAEIFAAARDLETAYAKAGFVLARVVLPPQHLVDGGRLKLTVVDGFIERIELKGVPEPVRQRIAGLVEPLVGRRGITLAELERRVLLAGDTPGTVLRSSLAPGEAEGATVLIIEAKYQPVSAVLTFDNSLSPSLGRTSLGTGVDLNSVAGFGELIYLRANGHAEQAGGNGFFDRYPTNRALAAGFVVPLWIDGLTFNAEGTDARTTPHAKQGLQTTDTFQRLSLRLRYAWLRGRAANFSSQVAFDAQNEMQSLFVGSELVPLSQDRLRIVRLTNDGDMLTPWGAAISGRVTGSFGLNALGARSAADATALLPLSRQGADASFQKADVSIGYNQRLFDHLTVYVTARAQTSFGQALLRSEQIGIASTSDLSGFDAGSIVGDQGYVGRAELSSPWALPLPTIAVGGVAAPYIFGAYGEVVSQNPTRLEAARIAATSYGGGVRFGGTVYGGLSNGSLAVEYAHVTRNDGVATAGRLSVVAAFRF